MGPQQRAATQSQGNGSRVPRRFGACSVVHRLAAFVLLLQVRQGASENEFEWSCSRALNPHLVGADEHLARPA